MVRANFGLACDATAFWGGLSINACLVIKIALGPFIGIDRGRFDSYFFRRPFGRVFDSTAFGAGVVGSGFQDIGQHERSGIPAVQYIHQHVPHKRRHPLDHPFADMRWLTKQSIFKRQIELFLVPSRIPLILGIIDHSGPHLFGHALTLLP